MNRFARAYSIFLVTFLSSTLAIAEDIPWDFGDSGRLEIFSSEVLSDLRLTSLRGTVVTMERRALSSLPRSQPAPLSDVVHSTDTSVCGEPSDQDSLHLYIKKRSLLDGLEKIHLRVLYSEGYQLTEADKAHLRLVPVCAPYERLVKEIADKLKPERPQPATQAVWRAGNIRGQGVLALPLSGEDVLFQLDKAVAVDQLRLELTNVAELRGSAQSTGQNVSVDFRFVGSEDKVTRASSTESCSYNDTEIVCDEYGCRDKTIRLTGRRDVEEIFSRTEETYEIVLKNAAGQRQATFHVLNNKSPVVRKEVGECR